MNQSLNIPAGKFAGEDAAAKKARELREQKRKALLEGKKLVLGNDQTAPAGKLAAQWYETNPQLLLNEKISMSRFYHNFTLEKLEDGRLCWSGTLNVGIAESKNGIAREYHVIAVYDNNHPIQQMGSSVKVYPVFPDVDELIEECKFIPHHLLRDHVNNLYLCTNEAGDQKIGQTTTTAASVLGWAQKWLMAYEFVLIGELSIAEFNRPGGI